MLSAELDGTKDVEHLVLVRRGGHDEAVYENPLAADPIAGGFLHDALGNL